MVNWPLSGLRTKMLFFSNWPQLPTRKCGYRGNDINQEGFWRWQTAGTDSDGLWQGTSTGMRLNDAYTNWAAGEPNDNGGVGDYMVMYTNGQWDDEANNGSSVANGYFMVNGMPMMYWMRPMP